MRSWLLRIFTRLSFVIGFILLSFILWSIDRDKTWQMISRADLYLLIAGTALTAPEALSKSLKLQSLARSQGRCRLRDALVAYFVGIPFGAVTPGKVGDFVKVYSLSWRTGMGRPKALAVWVLDRLLDLAALIIFGVLGALLLIANHTGEWIVVWIAGPCLIGIALLAVLLEKSLILRLVEPGLALLSSRGPMRGLGNTLRQALAAFYDGIDLARGARREMVVGFVFALLASVVISTRSYVFAAALSLNVAWLNFVVLIPLVVLVELLPISILGIGTREYAVIAIFAFLGVDREQAVSLSLTTFVLSLTPLALSGYLVALREHLRPSEIKSKEPTVG